MDFEYTRTITAPVQVVWEALTDPDAMEPHVPGNAKVERSGVDAFRVSMKISMGFLRPTVKSDVKLSQIDEPRSFIIELSGKAMGAGVSGQALVSLESDSQAQTKFRLAGTVETSGMLKKVSDEKIEVAAVGFLEAYFSSVETAQGAN